MIICLELVKCPGGIDGSAGQDECYADNQGEPKVPCSAECIGGCSAKTSPEHCYACRNLWYQLQNNSTVCVEKCPEGLLSVRNIWQTDRKYMTDRQKIMWDCYDLVNNTGTKMTGDWTWQGTEHDRGLNMKGEWKWKVNKNHNGTKIIMEQKS